MGPSMFCVVAGGRREGEEGSTPSKPPWTRKVQDCFNAISFPEIILHQGREGEILAEGPAAFATGVDKAW